MPNIIEIIDNGWRPILEITILSVGIYYCFKFVRGSRGAPVVYGFVLLLLSLTALSLLLRLEVLGWILRSFVAFAAVAVLIIFQPEFRRILAELGTHPFFNAAHEQREIIEVIIQAVERFSDVRIGALIAIEQAIQLQEATESGISVDCAATPEMLETIFFPNNAIHDGGVVIKGGRIAYAACIFPLTQRKDLNPSLGTRHRAAIGLSEETDALVVVVSEETGAISHAYKGQLTRHVTAEQLRAFLTGALVKQAKPHSLWSLFRLASARADKAADEPGVPGQTPPAPALSAAPPPTPAAAPPSRTAPSPRPAEARTK